MSIQALVGSTSCAILLRATDSNLQAINSFVALDDSSPSNTNSDSFAVAFQFNFDFIPYVVKGMPSVSDDQNAAGSVVVVKIRFLPDSSLLSIVPYLFTSTFLGSSSWY